MSNVKILLGHTNWEMKFDMICNCDIIYTIVKKKLETDEHQAISTKRKGRRIENSLLDEKHPLQKNYLYGLGVTSSILSE